MGLVSRPVNQVWRGGGVVHRLNLTRLELDSEFWLERWQLGQTAFHLDRPNPILLKQWSSLNVAAPASVLVPLCGKSQDLLWLSQQGYRVTGVELSAVAIQSFFEEQDISSKRQQLVNGVLWESNNLRIFEHDLFDLSTEMIGPVDVVFDRAALIALPVELRQRYVDKINALTGGRHDSLLITLEYDQEIMNGPPFSVQEREVEALYGRQFQVEQLSRQSIIEKMPRFKEKGLRELYEPVYRLTGHS